MQSIIYSHISERDLMQLFGVGQVRLNRWKKDGLPCRTDGRYSLAEVCRWLLEYHKKIEADKVTLSSISQRDLVKLTGLSRQQITFLGKNRGLPRQSNGSYNLQAVCQWLKGYYRGVYQREFDKRFQTMRHKIGKKIKQVRNIIEVT